MHAYLLGFTFTSLIDKNTCQKCLETHIPIILPIVPSDTWISKAARTDSSQGKHSWDKDR